MKYNGSGAVIVGLLMVLGPVIYMYPLFGIMLAGLLIMVAGFLLHGEPKS